MFSDKLRYKTVTSAVICLTLLGVSCRSQKNIIDDKVEIVAVERNDKDVNEDLYKEVESWLGTPYKYGGQTKKGTDCSGLVVEIYRKIYGKKLYRSSYEIYEKNCEHIDKDELREGDLVFFITSKKGKRINHIGLYLKNNKFVHSTTKRGVIITDLSENYYKKRFVGAGRVVIN